MSSLKAPSQTDPLEIGHDVWAIPINAGEVSSSKDFHHKPLCGNRSIRLLKVKRCSSPGQEAMVFSLVDRCLDDADLHYVAISYAWGSEDKAMTISLHDDYEGEQDLHITPSAHVAVHNLGSTLSPVEYMWIDQICIDQSNDLEKASQVRIMGDIYKRAHYTAIWLGSSDSSTAASDTLLEQIHTAFPPTEDLGPDTLRVASMAHSDIRSELKTKYGEDRLPPVSDEGWSAFARLLERSWFSRLWTFQEIVFSRHVESLVCCGHFSISYTTVARASLLLGSEPALWAPTVLKHRAAMLDVVRSRLYVEQDTPRPLTWLLQSNSSRDCGDARDRVYALLGVHKESNDTNMEEIRIDYTIPWQELYEDVARRIIRSQDSLRICIDAPERDEMPKSAELGLPSWVPNWTAQAWTTPFEYMYMRTSDSFFKACGTHTQHDATALITNRAGILRVRGKIVDTIHCMLDTHELSTHNASEIRDPLIYTVIPRLRSTLQTAHSTMSMTEAQRTHKVIKTLTFNGYYRRAFLGEFGFPARAWGEEVCVKMLKGLNDPRFLPGGDFYDVDQVPFTELWANALAKQSINVVNRGMAKLEHNGLGVVPKLANVGDAVAVLHGCTVPVLLRRLDDVEEMEEGGGRYEMLGICFVDGLMYGERVDWREEDADDFALV